MEPVLELAQQLLLPPLSDHTKAIAGEGTAGWAISNHAAIAIENGDDVVSLCLGDTSFDTPQAIISTAVESLVSGRTHYAPVLGTPELRKSIATAQARFDGQSWSANQVTVFVGAQNALFATVLAVAGAGDEVIYLEPWYATYEATIKVGGAIARPVPLAVDKVENRISQETLSAAVNSRTRAILLNSPNNPGGYVLTRQEIEVIAAVAVKHNLWILSDEVYRSAVFDGGFTSVASLPGIRNRTIVLNSLSKSHAMTGWRVGWALTPESVTPHLENLAQCMLFGTPTFIQDAAVAALSEAQDKEMRFFTSELKKRRDLMCARLGEIPGLKFARPAGGMFCFVDVSGTGLSGSEFSERLYESTGLAIVPGMAFGPNMRDFVRISFSASEETISEGMARFARFCAALR